MKKLIILCEILILLIFLAKIVMIGGIIKDSDTIEQYLSVNKALADSSSGTGLMLPVRDVCEDRLLKERELFAALLKKQKELEVREDYVKTEEKRLVSLKNEILSGIGELRELEGKLTILIESIKEFDDSKYKDLARIYESCPSAQAGSMLGKLDRKTAAAIIMNMKSKKAGEIWGHINPLKAVGITREITNTRLPSKGDNEE